MIVIYVEKKSVAKSIADALGAGEFRKKKDLTKQKLGILGYWNFSWNGTETYIIYGSGHLATLYSAKDYDSKYDKWSIDVFPCIPSTFKTKPVLQTIDFYNQALSLFKKADLIISATDSDREGQVVFAYLYRTTGVKTPWKRAWLPSDLSPHKIRQAFNNLEDWSVHYPLTLAGIVRSVSDWLIGCNLTVAATLKYGGKILMNEGRVQTTVLNMVVERVREIEQFKPTPFWKIKATISCKGESFTATLTEPKQFEKIEDAESLLQICSQARNAIIVEKTTKKRIVKKPLLYSTTELQIAVSKKYGYEVTKIASDMEALYNNHYITYPRTGAVVLSNALEKETAKNIKKLFSTGEYKHFFRSESGWSPFTNRHFDDLLIAKTEDSHTAIVPTGVIPDFNRLTVEQKNIYDMIAKSIIALVYNDAEIEDTSLLIDINGHIFKATGSVVLNYNRSWYSVLKNEADNSLPIVNQGDTFPFDLEICEGKTKPKPFYTQASLLKAMTYVDKLIDDEDVAAFMKSSECGLGTGATRPEIIGSLVRHQMMVIENKHLLPTEKGLWLIDHIPNELRMIKDPITTGKWEQMLTKIALSDLKTAKSLALHFLNNICKATRTYYNLIANSPTDLYSETESGRKISGDFYSCPKCGMPLRHYEWGFGCTGKVKGGCDFALGRFRGQKLSEKQLINLLENGKTGKLTLKTKEGKKYQGYLTFDDKKNLKFNFLK